MIYLDNAATSWPKPEIVYQTLDKFLREKGGNPGHGSHSLASAAEEVVNETRLLTARFINAAEVERIVFTLNCTQSINLGLKGVLHPGDQVITSSLEHNAVVRPLKALEKRGIKVVRIPVSPITGVTNPTDIEAAITPESKMLAMVHVSNVNGVIQPVEAYGEIARRRNLVFLVDAAQSAGHCPLDVQSAGIDLLAFSAHKGPLGPTGVGVLYISQRVNPEAIFEGGTGSASESEDQPERLPDKYESGTLNSLGIAGLGAGLKFIRQEGRERISAFENSLTLRLMEGLSGVSGLTLYNSVDPDRQAPVISLNIAGYTPGEVGAILDQAFDIKVRTGLHCAPQAHRSIGTYPGGSVRLSLGYFNTLEEIEKTILSIQRIAGAKRK